jgi:hypothetical protein
MARLTEFSFEISGSTYKLVLDFDDAALVEEKIAFDVVAEKSGGGLPPISVTARVEIDPAKDSIAIFLGGEEIFRTDVFDRGKTPAEHFIQGIPAASFADPILGCVVKGSLSAVVGQAIDCCRSLEGNLRWRMLPEFFRCMAQHFPKISKIAVFRAFKCILTADGILG